MHAIIVASSLAVAMAVVSFPGIAAASSWTQAGADIDGESAYDASGGAVALSSTGNRLAIGAYGNDGGGSLAGHVRVYDWTGTAWAQAGADIDGESAGDNDGTGVALSGDGNRLASGAYNNDGSGNKAGHVRVYDWTGTAWAQVGADIDGENAEDKSGTSVALSSAGIRVAIGAYNNDGNGSNAGHVRVFDWNGTVWTQAGADIDGESAGDKSGDSVALSADGNRVAIGGPYNDGSGTDAGHVRVYDWNGTAWAQVGADINGENAGDRSGYAVALSTDGTRLAIGAYYNDGSGTDAGHVRVYDWTGTVWAQAGADIDGESAGDKSGNDVALSTDGSRVAIGAYYNDGGESEAGHVRVYDWTGTAWAQVGADLDGESAGDKSGRAVALSTDGTRVAIGAYSNDGGGSSAGHVRVYDHVATPIPTLSQWGMILLTLSLLAIATWQLAAVPATATGVSGTVMVSGRPWLTSMLLGQVTATVGLGFYAVLGGPLVAHDGIGAFVAGVLLAVSIEGYRRAR